LVAGESGIEIGGARGPGARPSGRRFGELVHAVLATVGLDDDASAVAAQALVQARLLGASGSARDAASAVAVAALAHPLLAQAGGAAPGWRCSVIA